MDTEEGFYANKTILLLSDGKQNRGIDPLAITLPERIQVNAVGIGEDFIEPETIRDVANASGGDYRISPNLLEIEDFFVQILCNTSWKLQNVTVTGTTAPIDQDIAVFIAMWDDPSMSISFSLDPPGDGANITPSTLNGYPGMEVAYHAPTDGDTHAFYLMKNIPDPLLGNWQFINITDGSDVITEDNVVFKVVEDPAIIADFSIEPGDHVMGQPIILTATIEENGKPKTGLTDVYAELIRSPAIHVGESMASNSPPPDYPPAPSPDADRTPRAHYLLGVIKTLGLSTLTAFERTTIMLRDDGAGADEIAKDGRYSGIYMDTQKEGSYTFVFRAGGKDADGHIFDRTETLSEYVKFSIAPDSSTVEQMASISAGGFINTTLKITPCSKKGYKMGPFHGEAIQIFSDKGQVHPDYTDNKDGSYIYTITYPNNIEPKIAIAVDDVLITEQFQVK